MLIFLSAICAGDKIPLGLPALMMSPQDHPLRQIPHQEILRRDKESNINTESLFQSRTYIEPPPAGVDAMADFWKKENSGWDLELKKVPYGEQQSSEHVGSKSESQSHQSGGMAVDHEGHRHVAESCLLPTESEVHGGNHFGEGRPASQKPSTCEVEKMTHDRDSGCGEETHYSGQAETNFSGNETHPMSSEEADKSPHTHPSGCGTKKECLLVSPDAADGNCRRGY